MKIDFNRPLILQCNSGAVGDKISGKSGTLTFGSAVKITGWEITKNAGTFDSTDSSDASSGWKANGPTGWKDWSGKCDGFITAGEDNEPDTGTLASGVFNASATIDWTGNIIFQNVTITNNVVTADGVKFSATFIGSGALTKTDTSS
jgi:hypothetical protein